MNISIGIQTFRYLNTMLQLSLEAVTNDTYSSCRSLCSHLCMPSTQC